MSDQKGPKRARLRCYFVSDKNGECGVAYVARTAREARQRAIREQPPEYMDADAHVPEYVTRIRARWLREANIKGLSEGFVDFDEGKRRGIYHPSWDEWMRETGRYEEEEER